MVLPKIRKKFTTQIKFTQNHALWVFRPLEHESEHENFYDERLRVYKSILPKISRSFFVLKLLVWRYSGLKNLILSMDTRFDHVSSVYKSMFEKSSIFCPDPVIANLEVIQYQELNYE